MEHAAESFTADVATMHGETDDRSGKLIHSDCAEYDFSRIDLALKKPMLDTESLLCQPKRGLH